MSRSELVKREVLYYPKDFCEIMASREDPRLSKVGVSGYNKPKRTPSHKAKSHVVF